MMERAGMGMGMEGKVEGMERKRSGRRRRG